MSQRRSSCLSGPNLPELRSKGHSGGYAACQGHEQAVKVGGHDNVSVLFYLPVRKAGERTMRTPMSEAAVRVYIFAERTVEIDQAVTSPSLNQGRLRVGEDYIHHPFPSAVSDIVNNPEALQVLPKLLKVG